MRFYMWIDNIFILFWASYFILFQEPFHVQQSFSSETKPVLWKVYPLLEFIYKVWNKMAQDPKYAPMQAGINGGLSIIQKYTTLTEAADTNILCLVSGHVWDWEHATS